MANIKPFLALIVVLCLGVGHYLGSVLSSPRSMVPQADSSLVDIGSLSDTQDAGGAADELAPDLLRQDIQGDIDRLKAEIAAARAAKQRKQTARVPTKKALITRASKPPPPPTPPPVVAGDFVNILSSWNGLEKEVVIYGSAMQCVQIGQRGNLLTARVCDEQELITKSNTFTAIKGALAHNGKCLDVGPLSRDKGGKVTMTPCQSDDEVAVPNQQFVFDEDPSGRKGWGLLRNPASNLCLNLSYPSMQYTTVRAHPCKPGSCNLLTSVAPVGVAPDMTSLKAREKEIQTEARPGTRILCWILTYPKTHKTKAASVYNTWGPWCDKLIFYSSEPDDVLPITILNLTRPESRLVVWEKVRKAWLDVADNYMDDYDWFVKCDDDTVVMVDNLRSFVDKYNTEEDHYFGRWLVHSKGKKNELNYYSGGCGYVLSRSALRKVQENRHGAFGVDKAPDEDVEMGRRLREIGITPEDTRDEEGRERWMPVGVDAVRTSRYAKSRAKDPNMWFFSMSKFPTLDFEEATSKNWVATHYINPTIMKNLYYAHLLKCAASGSDDHW